MVGRRAGAVVAAAAVVVLVAGCGADSRSGDAAAVAPKNNAAVAPAAAPTAAATAAQPSGGGAPASAAPVVDNRLIAYTAQLTLHTKDVNQLLAKARELATSAGGYVGAESVTGSGAEGEAGGQLALKVPSAVYQQTLDQLAALGEVVARKSQADDLTQQVADVASRVQTQQASVERVRALMAQAKSLSEITTLEAELSRREADLESLQRQQKELAGKTSYSTITLDVRREAAPPTPAPTPPKKEDDGFWASVGSALGGGWHVLVTILRGLAVGVAAVAPFLLVAGPAALAYWLVRRRRPMVDPPLPEETSAEPTAEEQD
ncbi:DUF4349 domain-containing protein [Kitasatospora sp. NPDC097643]|uniref:DUF4349 domain-containing protein n=1 Tax=Kitasatospora sp. NPDC097643 TaxID=3157230 RepID=UPI0033215183